MGDQVLQHSLCTGRFLEKVRAGSAASFPPCGQQKAAQKFRSFVRFEMRASSLLAFFTLKPSLAVIPVAEGHLVPLAGATPSLEGWGCSSEPGPQKRKTCG